MLLKTKAEAAYSAKEVNELERLIFLHVAVKRVTRNGETEF
jgi:hypothetical protein